MIDTDEYIEMWNDNLLGSEGVNDLMNALIAVADFVSWVKETHPHYYHQLMNAYEGRPKQ